jgi:hypothetical protein
MPELARNIVGRLRSFIRDHRHEKRCSARLSFRVSLMDLSSHRSDAYVSQSVQGHTWDISASGLALIVPKIRIGDHYLAGGDWGLQIMLDLPNGPVEIEATPVRYESLEEQEGESGYMIGVRITQMSEHDRAGYEEYMATLREK